MTIPGNILSMPDSCNEQYIVVWILNNTQNIINVSVSKAGYFGGIRSIVGMFPGKYVHDLRIEIGHENLNGLVGLPASRLSFLLLFLHRCHCTWKCRFDCQYNVKFILQITTSSCSTFTHLPTAAGYTNTNSLFPGPWYRRAHPRKMNPEVLPEKDIR